MKKPPGQGREGASPQSRWQRGTDVRGIVPPGRRFSEKEERRTTRWSASGVRGVTPPGNARPEDSPTSRWAERGRLEKQRAHRANKKALEATKARPGEATAELDLTRPMAGFVPAVFDDLHDPDGIKAFLESVNETITTHRPPVPVAESFKELINQSRAPYELVVAFTILSAIIGKSTHLRRRYALALERGAKAFFNLARRLDPEVKVPRGLAPESLDTLFFDLPDIAMQVPFAYATDAFCRQIELLREDDPTRDADLIRGAQALRKRFIERRAFGDRPLRDLFPWSVPEWAPESIE